MKTMLQHVRETARLNQRDLASRAGISQETLSQLETGKSARPRLETLTKLRDALELGDLRPADLLEPCPLGSDPDLDAAASRLITLLKVLPTYRHGIEGHAATFWRALSDHLRYTDLYPATHLTAHLEYAITEAYSSAHTELAEYTLMFFDPDDTSILDILAKLTGIGPRRQIAYRWCRDVTDAAWILHRAAMTSYPEQIGALHAEAGSTDDPKRLQELCASVYDSVRGQALLHTSPEQQCAALREDPSKEVHYKIAHYNAHITIQQVAATIPSAWAGLATNPHLNHDVARTLVDTALSRLTGQHSDDATTSLFLVAERTDLPRELLEHIRATIDGANPPPHDQPGTLTSAVLAIRRTMRALNESPDQAQRPVQATDKKTSWWHGSRRSH